MAEQDDVVDFQRLNEALIRANAMAEAAESHGILCGLFCAEGKTDAQTWLSHVMGDKPAGDVLASEARDLLMAVHDATVEQITDGHFGLELLIRDEDDSLRDRVDDLSHWCQGFLVGLSLGGVSDLDKLPEEASEITKDLLEISKAGLESSEENEEGEAAYAEIVEYVRMGVYVIYSDLNPNDPVTPTKAAIH